MGSLKKEGEMEQIGDEFTEAILYVNGVRRVLPDGLAHMTLLEYLRGLGLTGTKLGCGEGGCGACTVMESLASSHGSQCGFCTPGFVMSMYALLRSNKTPPSEEEIEESLAGNLCRCTGYRPIVDAFRVFAKTNDALYSGLSSLSLQDGSSICPSTGKPCSCGDGRFQPISYSDTDGAKYTEKELIFPPELLLRKLAPLKLRGDGGMIWYRPVRLQYLLHLKAKHPEAKLLVGNTEVGIEMRLKRLQYQVLICVGQVPELNTVNVNDNGVEIGSALRLSELLKLFRKVVKERPAHETSACKAFIEQLKWFAGTQIRNVASVGGNICTASPISDLNPLWMASRAEFKIINCYGDVRSVRARDFFSGYRKVDMESNEILLSVLIPWTRPLEYVKEFKQAHRREDDIAIVNGGMRVFLEERGGELFVSEAIVAFGGVAPVTLRARKTEEFLIGKSWSKGLLQDALKVIQSDVLIDEDAPGGMVEFRKSLVLSFFFKFFLWVTHHLRDVKQALETFPPSYTSAVQSFARPCRAGRQDYETVTGEAEYTDDTPVPPNTLHAALVLSKMPHARIISIDDSESKSSPGFAGLFLAKDVPADNKIGPVVADEELFATDVVTCVGQVIGVVVADTHENAKAAAGKVEVEYEELPAILSIKEAIATKSFHPNTEKMLKKGDVEICFQSGQCDRIIEGEVQMGSQEHFYMEPHGSLVWTSDGGNEVHMISSTQDPHRHQLYVSHVLGLPMSKVVCKTKRIGGGFGGKETRSAFIAAAASVPSYLLNRPVKLILDRDVDMMISGHRHSFVGKYKVGFTNEGKVLAYDLEIYNNGGNSLDLSQAVLEIAMFNSDNVYEIPHVRIRGNVCFTNYPSNTAFRGFGGPQGMLITENWIQRIAAELDRSPEEIKAGALVHVYTDGTVLVTHGGVEMGQGLHTKVAQVAASAFNIPLSSVFVSETSTDKVPNASPTAASLSSDMYGAAVLDACEQIKARMDPVASKLSFNSFAELASACYFQRIDLSAHGFYIVPDVGFDWISGKGDPFRYYTYGAAFAEVEIDTLTGDFHTRTVDIKLDLGYSLNPAIDIGQIEGAFVQGLGWVALEEVKWGDAAHKWIKPGNLVTCGPGNYKIPSINDIPFNFNVSLLKGNPNSKGIHSSKAVGEPPFFLASSVLFAIKDAVKAARAEVGLGSEWFPLDTPATPERIRMACFDEFTCPFVSSDFCPELTHGHQLTLLPRLFSFSCNACGLKGDRSPYMCVQCDFMIHQDCLGLPRVININRHNHRVSRTSILGVVNSVCGVCRKKVDWTCGGFSCQRCPGYVVHSKCATREDVWNGKELEGVPEEDEDVEPYVVVDENTIQHFSHKEHYLRLHRNGVLYEDNKWLVEINTLTGNYHTRTVDIEGAFVQGLGWVAIEEVKWGDAALKWIKPGFPSTYRFLFSSQETDPRYLGQKQLVSLHAIKAARAEVGLGRKWFNLDTPATPERILGWLVSMSLLLLLPQTNRWRDETQRRKIAKAFPIFPISVRRWRRIWLVRLNLERMNGFNPNKGWVFVEGEPSSSPLFVYDHQMESEGGVLLPLFHEHPMMPWNDLRRGDCCGRYESQSDGYYCKLCVFFVHKKCGNNELSQFIDHPSHPNHTLQLRLDKGGNICDLCGWKIAKLCYRCQMCDCDLDLHCANLPRGLCMAPSNRSSDRGPPPDYSDGKCRLCGTEIDKELFYHCSSCNFTLDMPCVLNPPQKTLVDPKVHDHQLTLLPRLDSFTCNACGLKGDRSPYACFDCGFMIHQDCLALPRVININRHDHRVSRTSVLGDAAMNSVCGVCRKKVDWTCGGFYCKRCPGYVFHSKCATRNDVWNGKELEGVPEEEEGTEPYVVIDENTIQHFSHKEHYLRRIHGNGVFCMRITNDAAHASIPSVSNPFMDKCAECPKKKRHVLHNERLTLVTNKELEVFSCDACYRRSNGFMYKDGGKEFDVLCGSISEPFVHPSHPQHPLYYIPTEEVEICNGCNSKEDYVLRCIEDDCRFVLCFKCATLPQVVKHRVDDHPLSLCYGEEEEASGKYWCDICERETNPKEWFYTCKDQRASLHTECVLGDSAGLMPRSIAEIWCKSFEVELNNSVTRPFCKGPCKDRCKYPIYFKLLGRTSETYLCSLFSYKFIGNRFLRTKRTITVNHSISIDDSKSKLSPGFAGLFLAKDVPADNKIGPVVADEELFATDVVTSLVWLLRIHMRMQKLQHEKLKLKLPAILSIKEAIAAESFHPNTEKMLRKGDVELCFQSGQCDKIIEGEVQMGSQEHFYMEPHGSLDPHRHQQYVSHVLGLPMSKVVCKTKRIGGGFGGKETRSAFIAAAASVPSYLLNRPVKLILDRDVDMMISGHRHSFVGKYKVSSSSVVGFTNDGKVLAYDLENNGGNSLDLSEAVLEIAMFNSDNVYEIPHVRIRGNVCFTNYPSNTAFLGFGGPQGMLIIENWIQRIAAELDRSPEEMPRCMYPIYFKFLGNSAEYICSIDCPYILLESVPADNMIGTAVADKWSHVWDNKWFPLYTPATPERIRMACFNEFITSPFVSLDISPKLNYPSSSLLSLYLFIYESKMESEGVSLPFIHEHPMKPFNDLRKVMATIAKPVIFSCTRNVATSSLSSSTTHLIPITLSSFDMIKEGIVNLCYRCEMCDFDVDLDCAKYPPPDVIDNFETHRHKLPLFKEHCNFKCTAKCGKGDYDEFPYICDECDVAFHVYCVWHPEASELNYSPEVNHSYHSLHPLKLLTGEPPEYSDGKCRLCGTEIGEFFYHCSFCNFTVDLPCVLNPPQKSLVDPKAHDHQLTLLPRLDSFTCNACGLKEIEALTHALIVYNRESKMEFEGGVLLPLFHEHPMTPWNDHHMRKVMATIVNSVISSCTRSVATSCLNSSSTTPSHPDHTLRLQEKREDHVCYICDSKIQNLSYRCEMCDFHMDLHCAKYPPPDMHPHKLTFVKELSAFHCSAKCGKTSADAVAFHVECVWHPAALEHSTEVNHPYHSLHPLKLFKGPPPDYSDGKCRLCGRKVDKELFYHCSSCNFTLDWRCVVNPPPQSLLNLKAHDHQLKLLPRLLSFTCNACGLKGDRSPYMCVQCDFMIHQGCLGLPRVININRHDHRVSRTLLLGDGAMNSVCEVCHKKVDWTCGGFSCQTCPNYVVHSKCATRYDVWNMKELEGVPEEEEDIEPYVVIDDNTIQHFSHKEHYLIFNENGVLYEDKKRCSACTHPIGLQSFYVCMDCDFSLHQCCAKCPKKKRHVLHNERLTLVTNKELEVFDCVACNRTSNGFMYKDRWMSCAVQFLSHLNVITTIPYITLSYYLTIPLKRREYAMVATIRNIVYSSALKMIVDL
ncbi:LOW QUALITY PROTEIN: hypothetical protein HID58_093669 [Brassica napus]|uniref:FAD-binding PCMH-type domain-containing protein n=1 Tax=Brassica napus TaxID=3708 RepID=A0ABQ7XAI9_BRANA|nr:LOW QUALITY PROTEIN: hypothetical protein HID58_093669 [Brassica napus]